MNSILFPHIFRGDQGFPHPKQLSDLSPLKLSQHWDSSQPMESAHVYVGHNEKGIRFYAWMEEGVPFTKAL